MTTPIVPYRYWAHVLSVYDGDTITVRLDLGLNIHIGKRQVRLFGIDTPELRGDEREEGLKVRDHVRGLILGKDVVLKTHRDKSGKYGRLLGEVLYDAGDGWANLNEELVGSGMAELEVYGRRFDGWATP